MRREREELFHPRCIKNAGHKKREKGSVVRLTKEGEKRNKKRRRFFVSSYRKKKKGIVSAEGRREKGEGSTQAKIFH